jgi:hypothetical protein
VPLCYSLEELHAEKTRALLERTRPRDLYDVVHLWDRRADVNLASVRDVLARKCAAKNVIAPTSASLTALVRGSPDLRGDWGNMLSHQLPALPALDTLLARLEEVLGWIDAREPSPAPVAVHKLAAGEQLIAPRGGFYWGGNQRLELVRFAGANRLKIAFTYNGTRRVVEPYSLRRKGSGNLLLYAWENGAASIKAFKTVEMFNVETTDEPFVPRYRVELTG